MYEDRITKVFLKTMELETARLKLRRLHISDTDDMFEYASNPVTTEYLLWSPHEDRYQTGEYLAQLQIQYKTGKFHDWAVILKSCGKMIGTCGYTSFSDENRRGEIGYVISPSYWNHGYACESAAAVTAFGFEELKLERIEAKFIRGNERSRAVMEKIGMQYEGMLRSYMLIKGKMRDIGICSITREEYLALKGEDALPYVRKKQLFAI